MAFASFKIIGILFLLFVFSCRQNEDHLIGRWKVVAGRFKGGLQWETPFFADLTKPDSLRLEFFNRMTKDLALQGSTSIDSNTLMRQVDSMITYYRGASLVLKQDSSFEMFNNGFIIPNVIPGWHFGDTLGGTWSKQKESLILHIGNDKRFASLQFRILKFDKESLTLRESAGPDDLQSGSTTSDDSLSGTEITFTKDKTF